jgi:prepilin-type N-terminal cleavage/methylation domain-containing protein
MMHGTAKRLRQRGMTLIELLIVLAILAGLLLLVAPVAGKIIRRSQLVAAHSTLKQVLATARLQAVKRGSNVVVLVSLSPDNKLRLVTFQDRANDETNPLPADEANAAGNFKQDSGFAAGPTRNEPTLGDITLPSTVVVWKQGGTKNDLTSGVAFDDYDGDTTLTNRIAFLPTGGIAPPEDTVNSGQPTPSGGRGIYFGDVSGRNFFRVTVDSDLSGRIRVEKFQQGLGYVPNGWTWY